MSNLQETVKSVSHSGRKNAKKQRIPTHLNITIKVPICENRQIIPDILKSLQEKLLNLSRNTSSDKDGRNNHCDIDSNSIATSKPIKETIDEVNALINQHTDLILSKSSDKEHDSCPKHNPLVTSQSEDSDSNIKNIDDVGSYTSFVNHLDDDENETAGAETQKCTNIPSLLNIITEKSNDMDNQTQCNKSNTECASAKVKKRRKYKRKSKLSESLLCNFEQLQLSPNNADKIKNRTASSQSYSSESIHPKIINEDESERKNTVSKSRLNQIIVEQEETDDARTIEGRELDVAVASRNNIASTEICDTERLGATHMCTLDEKSSIHFDADLEENIVKRAINSSQTINYERRSPEETVKARSKTVDNIATEMADCASIFSVDLCNQVVNTFEKTEQFDLLDEEDIRVRKKKSKLNNKSSENMVSSPENQQIEDRPEKVENISIEMAAVTIPPTNMDDKDVFKRVYFELDRPAPSLYKDCSPAFDNESFIKTKATGRYRGSPSLTKEKSTSSDIATKIKTSVDTPSHVRGESTIGQIETRIMKTPEIYLDTRGWDSENLYNLTPNPTRRKINSTSSDQTTDDEHVSQVLRELMNEDECHKEGMHYNHRKVKKKLKMDGQSPKGNFDQNEVCNGNEVIGKHRGLSESLHRKDSICTEHNVVKRSAEDASNDRVKKRKKNADTRTTFSQDSSEQNSSENKYIEDMLDKCDINTCISVEASQQNEVETKEIINFDGDTVPKIKRKQSTKNNNRKKVIENGKISSVLNTKQSSLSSHNRKIMIDDSSEDDERDFVRVMEYLKEFAGNEHNFDNNRNKVKSNSSRRNANMTLTHKLSGLNSSDSCSSDSSISMYATPLKKTYSSKTTLKETVNSCDSKFNSSHQKSSDNKSDTVENALSKLESSKDKLHKKETKKTINGRRDHAAINDNVKRNKTKSPRQQSVSDFIRKLVEQGDANNQDEVEKNLDLRSGSEVLEADECQIKTKSKKVKEKHSKSKESKMSNVEELSTRKPQKNKTKGNSSASKKDNCDATLKDCQNHEGASKNNGSSELNQNKYNGEKSSKKERNRNQDLESRTSNTKKINNKSSKQLNISEYFGKSSRSNDETRTGESLTGNCETVKPTAIAEERKLEKNTQSQIIKNVQSSIHSETSENSYSETIEKVSTIAVDRTISGNKEKEKLTSLNGGSEKSDVDESSDENDSNKCCNSKAEKTVSNRNKNRSTKVDVEPQKLVSDYFDRILTERYGDKRKRPAKSAEYIVDSDSSSDTLKCGVSDFETENEKANEATKAKMLEIISHANDDLLNVLEENEQLRTLSINIPWDVPLSHTIETRVSACPTKKQQQLFKEFNIKFKTGPYTRDEDEAIKENFKEFCIMHGLNHDPVPFLNFTYGSTSLLRKEQRLNFARYLGKGLSDRKLSCIYSRFKVLYSTYNKGRYTPEEDAVILEYMKVANNRRNQFSCLSKILNRPRPSIERRHKLLRRESEMLQPKDYPTFVKHLMEVTNSVDLQDLKNKEITGAQWADVSKRVNVFKDDLKVCWRASLYTKLFHEGPINVDDIMRKLIIKLDEAKEDDYRKLNWIELAKPFENITRAFLYRIYRTTMKSKVPLQMHTNLRECVLYLKKLYASGEPIMPNINTIDIQL